ncbi:MAG: hypothetical protein HC918_10005 [Oscillatoriales cyanobacterium SM2_1_8]|nr:hypothetical protein [Oscillatoriales cyanobacterium SM2_1_8]
MADLHQEMRDRDEDLREYFAGELKTATETLEKKVKQVGSNAQDECADMRMQLDRTTKKVTAGLQELDEEVETLRTTTRDEVGQLRGKLDEELKELKDSFFDELNRLFSQLREVKISRDDMAELLFELGMRLKGTEFVPELVEAAEEKYAIPPESLGSEKPRPSRRFGR